MSLNVPRQQEYERSTTPNQRLTSPRYDRNDDGDVEFKYVIDVSDFRPEEIQVTQSGQSVTISASTSKTVQSSETNSSCSRSEKKEYHKTISLPTNSDMTKKLQTNYENGKLVIKMPVITSSYNSVFPKSALSSQLSKSQRDSTIHSHFFSDDDMKKYTEKLHLGPGFSRDSIKINVSGEVVTVSATEVSTDIHGCHSTRQYSSEHKFPINVDLNNIEADWQNGDLMISAPFKF